MADTIQLGKIISGELPVADFYSYFNGKYSENFNPVTDLEKIGVVNQTTQLATDTQAISDYLKSVMVTKFGESELPVHFADTRDTLCYATNDNQTAVNSLLEIPADIAFVMGGKNSSNSSHLVELCENKLPTYFIDGPEKLIDANSILNTNWRNKEQTIINNYLPIKDTTTILMTSGASCPDTVVEAVIRQIADYYNVSDALKALEAKWIH
jgi:4-hydroxy-3-methylbut-2-enyl diphosphate reductase